MTDISKITASHRERLCLVYVRQSTLAQTRVNTESLERQYELAGRAVALGWDRERVQVVDADLGLSGADAAGREGFQQLVAEVALGRAGLVMGLEASRLARSNSDWYQLLDLCGVTGTLIADGDGIYDPAAYSDRLVLGLKGTISEAELHLIKGRLIAGMRHKAAKGELRVALPAGLEYDPAGQPVLSADEAVREAITTVFRRFTELGSARQVMLSMRDDGLELPRSRAWRIEWVPASYGAVIGILANPCYAGTFAFGRTRNARPAAGVMAAKGLGGAWPRKGLGLSITGRADAGGCPERCAASCGRLSSSSSRTSWSLTLTRTARCSCPSASTGVRASGWTVPGAGPAACSSIPMSRTRSTATGS